MSSQDFVTLRLTQAFPAYGLRVGDFIACDSSGPILQRCLTPGEIPHEVLNGIAEAFAQRAESTHPRLQVIDGGAR